MKDEVPVKVKHEDNDSFRYLHLPVTLTTLQLRPTLTVVHPNFDVSMSSVEALNLISQVKCKIITFLHQVDENQDQWP